MTKNIKIQNNINKIILISSLNGGTGKSAITFQIKELYSDSFIEKNQDSTPKNQDSTPKNQNIGILDADINSLGLTNMLRISNQNIKSVTDSHGNTIVEPFDLNKIKFVSAGMMDIGTHLMGIRGGALSALIKLMINDVNWEKLDYLFIDLPSGLSDIELTILDDYPEAEILMISNGNFRADKRKIQYYIARNTKILGVFHNIKTFNDNIKPANSNKIQINSIKSVCENNNITYFNDLLQIFPTLFSKNEI